jgi:DNA-binding MarR family transcriptional regulator
MKNIIRITHQVNKSYSQLCQQVMQKYNITRCELDILLFLYNNPDLNTAKDIVEKRGIIKSQASMGIDQLIQKNYVKTIRDVKDKRKYHLYLLDDAQAIINDGLRIQQVFAYKMFKNISQENMTIFNMVLKQIYQNLKEEE